MDAIKNAFRGFDLNDMDFANAGNWPVGAKVVSYLLLVVLICAAGWHFYAADKRVDLQREVNKEVALKKVYKDKSFQVANLDALRKQMADVEGKFAELLKQLPTEKEVPGLLDDITDLGKDSGLSIGAIALAAESKTKFYIELPINISVQGSYHQLGQFVSGIAALSRIVTLHNYTISPSGNGLSMNILAKTYRYDDTK